MTDTELLNKVLTDSGITITHIAKEMGCSRNRVYAILRGSEVTATEIYKLCEIFKLTAKEKDRIFFAKNVYQQ